MTQVQQLAALAMTAYSDPHKTAAEYREALRQITELAVAAAPLPASAALQALIDQWQQEVNAAAGMKISTDLSTWGCIRYADALKRCAAELEAALSRADTE